MMDILKYDEDTSGLTSAWSNFTCLVLCGRTHHTPILVSKIHESGRAWLRLLWASLALDATGHFWWVLAQFKLNHGLLGLIHACPTMGWWMQATVAVSCTQGVKCQLAELKAPVTLKIESRSPKVNTPEKVT